MNRRVLLPSVVLLFLLSAATSAQEPPAATPPPPPAPAAPAEAPGPPPAFAAVLLQGGNFLGVQVEDVTRENMGRYGVAGEPRGVAVTRIIQGSPAARAGLRERDVITRFDGEAVTSVRKLDRLIEESAPEHTARLTVLRNGSEQEVSVTLGRRQGLVQSFGAAPLLAPAQAEELRRRAEELRGQGEQFRRQSEELRRQGEEMRKQFEDMRRENPSLFALGVGNSRRIGVTTTPIGQQLAEYFGVTEGHGLLVNSVAENSPASRAGIKAGDVITEVDGEQVKQAGDIARALGRKQDGEVTLTIVRNRKRRAVRVTPERAPTPSFGFTPESFVIAAPALHIVMTPRVVRVPRVTVTPTRVWRAPRDGGRVL